MKSTNLILFVCCLILCVKTIDAHEIILEKIEIPLGQDSKFLTFDKLRVKKFNRTSFVFDGKYDLKVPLDDDIDMKIEAFNFQGGQYKKIGEKRFDKFCASVYDDMTEKQFAKFYAASTLKVPFGTCPFPAGESEITNLMVDDDGILPPYIPGGEKWRADVRFLKKTKILGGFNVYALIRNEQSLLKGG